MQVRLMVCWHDAGKAPAVWLPRVISGEERVLLIGFCKVNEGKLQLCQKAMKWSPYSDLPDCWMHKIDMVL